MDTKTKQLILTQIANMSGIDLYDLAVTLSRSAPDTARELAMNLYITNAKENDQCLRTLPL